MFIFGLREKAYNYQKLEEKCDHCGYGAISGITYQKYFHIFWIPFIPLFRKVRGVCQHCKKVYEHNEASGALSVGLSNLKHNSPIVWKWSFSGLVLVALLVGHAEYKNQQEIEIARILHKNPMVGDVLLVKDFTNQDKSHPYIIAKVSSVSEQGVGLLFSSSIYAEFAGKKAVEKGEYSLQEETVVLPNLEIFEIAKYKREN